MKSNRIKQTVNETILLIKKQKWTRKKTIPLIMIGLLVVFFLVFLNGNSGGYEYIKVGEQHYTEKIVAVGQLGMENQNEIVSQVNGKVDFIGAEEGGTISAGAIIISIKNPEQMALIEQKKAIYLDVQQQYNSLLEYDYVLAKEELIRVTLLKQQAETAFNNAQTLYREGAISQNSLIEYENAYQSAENQLSATRLQVQAMGPSGTKRDSLFYKLENAKSIYLSSVEDESKYKIKAGWDSVILSASVQVNDTVKPGDLLLDVGQAETYSVITDLDEKYFLYVSKGMKVDIQVVGQDKTKGLKGEVSGITPKINKNTGTFQVKIKLLSTIAYKASDLTVNIEIVLKEKAKAIVIPNQYLIGDEEFVFVYKDGRAVRTEVGIERGPSSKVIITQGLREGDIVLLPTETLKDGERVKLKKGVDPT